MFKDQIFLALYKKAYKVLGNKNLTKYTIIRKMKKFATENFKSNQTLIEGHKIFLDKEDCMQLSIRQSYDPVETELVKKEIKEGSAVIDIGANMGYYTLLFAKLVGKKGKVYSFEPEPNNFALLKKNISINNYHNVNIQQKAVSNTNKKINLYLSKKSTGQHTIAPSRFCDKKIQVKSIRLDDDINEKIDFVKIDVEGAEYHVLSGMKNILKNQKIKLLLEFQTKNLQEHSTAPDDFFNFLEAEKFKIFYINKKTNSFEPLINKDDIIQSEMAQNLFCIR